MLDTRTDLRAMLKDPSLLETRAFVAGEWVSADDGRTFEVRNPARGDVIAEVADLTRAETARAIAAAELAQKEWAARTGKERAGVLRKWYELMVANADDLAAILTAEMGKPLAEAKGEILYGAAFVEWFGEEAKRVYGETIPGHLRDKRITVLKQPIGVAASITPWNFPNAMITRKAGPALAAGCAMVLKPASQTPFSAIALAVLAERDPFLEEAARTMGATRLKRLWFVTLPQCRPGLFAGAFFAFNISFDEAVLSLFLRNPNLTTLPVQIYGQLEFSPDPTVAAVSTVMIMITLVLMVLLERLMGLNRFASG